MIEIKVNDAEINRALDKLAKKTSDISPALKGIGDELVKSTKKRFASGTDPDGNKWAKNSDVTIERKGRNQPLVDQEDLASQIQWQILNQQTLAVGSNADQVAMMHFGGTKAEFPWLWGDIPERRIFGLSAADKDVVLTELTDYLDSL